MQEKIKWYQEVLELEPGSKVFFPLARLLVESGQIDAALQTLQQGLVRYPEFIEARLYLIDVLFTHNRSTQCNEQVSALTSLFASYTGFWKAWGAYLAHNEQDKEVSLALTFLAASFQNPHLRLADIFTHGLQNLHAVKQPASPAPCGTESTPPSTTQRQGENEGALTSRITIKCNPATTALSKPGSSAVVLSSNEDIGPSPLNTASISEASLSQEQTPPTVPPLAELVQSLPSPKEYTNASDASANASEADADGEDSEDGEERFSLRTRSMAEVLAEQGDFKNALDIYQELTAQAVTPEEQLDLQHRISTLTARMGSVQGQPADSPSMPDTAHGKHRLLSLLETLAVRFEAHAQG